MEIIRNGRVFAEDPHVENVEVLEKDSDDTAAIVGESVGLSQINAEDVAPQVRPNVGTIGHHSIRGTGGKLRRAANLASLIAIASAGANLEQVLGSKALGLGAKREPAPRTQADLDRLRAAEDRRQRRMARNLGQQAKK